MFFLSLFLTVLGLCCCPSFSLVAESGDCSLAAVLGLLIWGLLLLQSTSPGALGFQELRHVGSAVAAPGL